MRSSGFGIVSVLIGVACLGLAGGSIWYFGMYQPAQHASRIISLFGRYRTEGAQMYSMPAIRENNDYQEAFRMVTARKNFYEKFRNDLNMMRQPIWNGTGNKTHDIFSQALEGEVALAEKAEDLATFLEKAQELATIFFQISNSRTSVGDFVVYLETNLSGIERLTGEMFSKEPPEIRETPVPAVPEQMSEQAGGAPVLPRLSERRTGFVELKAAWKDADPALRVILEHFRALDPDMPQRDWIAERVPLRPGERPTGIDEAFMRLSVFIELLNSFLHENPAPHIADYRSFAHTAVGELSAFDDALNKSIQNLKRESQ